MSLNFNSIITEVTKVQEEASKILLSPEEHGLSREIILKEQGKDYTQEIDRHIEGMIKERFSLLFPEIGFMGEETDSRGEDKRFSWLVDPLDGTSPYNTGGVYYSTVMALLDREQGKVQFSSVYHPSTRKQFLRLHNEVSVIERIIGLDGKERLIERKPAPSKSAGAPELLGLTSIPSKFYDRAPKLKAQLDHLFDQVAYPQLKNRMYGLKDSKPASGSSGLFFSDIADGNRHFALSYFQAPWDMVSALYARDAGCVVECGRDLETFNGGDLEYQIAKSDKKTLINVQVFANNKVKDIILNRLGSIQA